MNKDTYSIVMAVSLAVSLVGAFLAALRPTEKMRYYRLPITIIYFVTFIGFLVKIWFYPFAFLPNSVPFVWKLLLSLSILVVWSTPALSLTYILLRKRSAV